LHWWGWHGILKINFTSFTVSHGEHKKLMSWKVNFSCINKEIMEWVRKLSCRHFEFTIACHIMMPLVIKRTLRDIARESETFNMFKRWNILCEVRYLTRKIISYTDLSLNYVQSHDCYTYCSSLEMWVKLVGSLMMKEWEKHPLRYCLLLPMDVTILFVSMTWWVRANSSSAIL
jgi:hypothetical protein